MSEEESCWRDTDEREVCVFVRAVKTFRYDFFEGIRFRIVTSKSFVCIFLENENFAVLIDKFVYDLLNSFLFLCLDAD